MSDNKVVETKELNESTVVDLDEYGMVVGIEFLNLDEDIPYELLVSNFHLSEKVIEVVKSLRPTIINFINQQPIKYLAPIDD